MNLVRCMMGGPTLIGLALFMSGAARGENSSRCELFDLSEANLSKLQPGDDLREIAIGANASLVPLAALKQGLTVKTCELEDRNARTTWHFYLLESRTRSGKFGFFAPHDTEDSAFLSMVSLILANGGKGLAIRSDGERSLRTTLGSIDPNRYFQSEANVVVKNDNPKSARTGKEFTDFVTRTFEGLDLIIALHSNERGYDPRDSAGSRTTPVGQQDDSCAAPDVRKGRGNISICLYKLKAARRSSNFKVFQGDTDADTFILTPFKNNGQWSPIPCLERREFRDENIVYEPVKADSYDGSLSNYWTLAKRPGRYFNIEVPRSTAAKFSGSYQLYSSEQREDLLKTARRQISISQKLIDVCGTGNASPAQDGVRP